MNVRCLRSTEVGAVLLRFVDEHAELEEELTNAIDAAYRWDLHLICLNLFVARHIRYDDHGSDKIDRLYTAAQETAMEYQEIDYDMVEYLLRHERNPEETLDEALIIIQEGLSSHDYEKAIRY